MLPPGKRQDLVRQSMRQPRLGDGHREGPQHRVGQRHRGTAAQAIVEGLERALQAQPTEQAAGQRTDDQGDHHVHPAQAEHQHDADRNHHRVHALPPLAPCPARKTAHSAQAPGPCQTMRGFVQPGDIGLPPGASGGAPACFLLAHAGRRKCGSSGLPASRSLHTCR
ncbi:hypothetical protein FQZ97_730610 [compost metagenome]